MVRYTKEELVKMVQEHSKILGRTPKMKEVAKNENFPSMNLFLREFETWNNLLKKCNLKLNSVRYYSKEHLLNVLKLLSNRIGRTSRIEDLNGDKDLPSPKVYFSTRSDMGKLTIITDWVFRFLIWIYCPNQFGSNLSLSSRQVTESLFTQRGIRTNISRACLFLISTLPS